MSLRVERWNQHGQPVARELRQVLQSEGYDVSEWTDASGTVYPPHSHSEDQSHWIISGELEIEIDDQTYRLGTGDRDFLPANTKHAAFVPGDEPVRYLIGAKRS